MAQVVEPQLNLPLQGLSRESPSQIAVFERILQGSINKSIFLNQVYYYKLQLIGEILPTGRLTSVRRRPRAGSIGYAAPAEAVRKALDLPAIEGENIIGKIHDTEIPIAVDWTVFKYHILVAGATGSGKSNSVANLIKAAQTYNACVIIYDQKPDYQNIKNANDEDNLFKKWDLNIIYPVGLENTQKYCLWNGNGEKEADETEISIRARDVPLNTLVNALFPYPDEANQRDTFLALLDYYKNNHNSDWTLVAFSDWLKDVKTHKKLQGIYDANGWGEVNNMNLDATLKKVLQRKMKWIDSLNETSDKQSNGIFDKSRNKNLNNVTNYFVPKNHLERGKVLVIRTNAEGREYGLFLSYMLKEVFDLKRQKIIEFPIVNIIDEAQDIFQGGAAIRDTATSTLNEIMRKGRSKDIGFVVAVQSVSQVPDSVLTNLNTRFIHRQNSVEELRIAIPSASRSLMATSLTFGPGEALASIIGTRSVVQAERAFHNSQLNKGGCHSAK